MASWFTRALDTLTPWDRGGEVQRRQEEEERQRQQSFSAPPSRNSSSISVAPTQQRQNISVQEPPKPKAPVNVFEANKNLVFNQPQNEVQVSRNQASKPPERPKPGQVFKPQNNRSIRLPDGRVYNPSTFSRSELDRRNQEAVDNTAANLSNWEKIKRFGLPSFGRASRDAVVDLPRQFARSFVKIPLEAIDAANGKQEGPSFDPNNNKITRFIYGSEPITPSSQEGQDIASQFTDNETAQKAAGLVNLGFDLADVIGVGTLLKSGIRNPARSAAKSGVPNRVSVPVRQVNDIPVRQVSDDAVNVPVRNATEPKPLIREVGGDAPVATSNSQIKENAVNVRNARAADRVAQETPVVRPDRSIEGVTPRNFQDITGVTRKAIEEERLALDEALANKEINKTQHKAANKELDDMVAQAENVPKGKPIEVKEVSGIDVNNIDVPQNLPETPGRVRVTTSTEPMKAKSEAIANESTPVGSSEPVRPDGELADSSVDPTAPKGSEDFAPTGKFAESSQTGGGTYEKASREAEQALGEKEMATRSVEDLVDELIGKNKIEAGDQRRIQQAMTTMAKADPENYRNDPLWKVLADKNVSNRRKVAQILALGNRTVRKSATADALTNRWYNKVSRVVDSSKISDADIDKVAQANNKFTQLRDQEAALEQKWLNSGSEKDFKAWENANKQMAQADIDAKTVELNAAKNASKGSKEENVAKVISDMEREADLNMMDYVTSSQLSGPATGFRNFVGTELAGVENRLFANTRSKIANKLFGENVGGYSRSAAQEGRKEGVAKFGDDIRRRAVYSGKNPFKIAQNWATSVNSLGDSSLYSQARSRLGKYYENQLKQQGYSGKELDMRTKHAMTKDPDAMGEVFVDSAMKSSGLKGLYQKSQTIEKSFANYIADSLPDVVSPKMADRIGRGIARLTLGYPTATTNFIAQSTKRTTVGIPSFIETGVKLARGDKQAAAMAFDRGLKEAGSGAAMFGTGVALNEAGLITGFYPDDPDERQRWTDEGKSELSINIGGSWYPIPTQFGMLGLPIIFGSEFNEGGVNQALDVFTDREKVSKLLPTDQAYGTLQLLAGDATTNQDKSFVASTIRSFIPDGSLLAQTAKGLDDTANDTTTKDFWSNVFDQVASGIPGLNEMANIPDKLSSTGESIKNPNLAQTYSGARSVEQPSGIANSQEVDKQINSNLQKLEDYGLINNPDLEGVLDDTGVEALNKYKNGQQLDESDIKALESDLVKGVSLSGTDTAYLEREQYDTNLAVLKLKRDLAQNDPTVNPSSIKSLDTAIKRGEVYRDSQMPYQDISDYQSIGVEEWRKMGDPEEDEYNPEMYQKLWEIDQKMTDAGVSYKRGELKKNKYYLKESKSGSGRGGSRAFKTNFGTLSNSGRLVPQVQAYQTIDAQTGSIPVIRTIRPNIVHKISASG